MRTKKRSITFYADPDIEEWYAGLKGNCSRSINDAIKRGLGVKTDESLLLERVEALEQRIKTLEEQCQIKSNTP